MAAILRQEGHLSDAISIFKQAITLNPHYAKSYSNIGIGLTEAETFEDALNSYVKALQIDPNDRIIWMKLFWLRKILKLDGTYLSSKIPANRGKNSPVLVQRELCLLKYRLMPGGIHSEFCLNQTQLLLAIDKTGLSNIQIKIILR